MKVGFGPDGAHRDVDDSHPLPVAVAFPATQPVSATELPLPTGAATEANQAAGNTLLTTIGNLLASTQVVALESMGATVVPANTTLDARRYGSIEFLTSAANVSVTRSYDNTTFFPHPVFDPLGNAGSGTMSGTTGAVGFWNVDGDAYLRFSADVTAIGRS